MTLLFALILQDETVILQDEEDDEAPYSMFSYVNLFSASGETILVTQRYLHVYTFSSILFSASGEAILGRQRYLHARFPIYNLLAHPARRF